MADDTIKLSGNVRVIDTANSPAAVGPHDCPHEYRAVKHDALGRCECGQLASHRVHCDPSVPPPTVSAYFKARLGRDLFGPELDPPEHSPAHPNFHIETGCGVDCAGAIDAAADLLAYARMAGVSGGYKEQVIELTRATVGVFVYG